MNVVRNYAQVQQVAQPGSRWEQGSRTRRRRRGQICLQFVLTKPVFFVTKLGAGPLHKALRETNGLARLICAES
jgi:hypothetical protein